MRAKHYANRQSSQLSGRRVLAAYRFLSFLDIQILKIKQIKLFIMKMYRIMSYSTEVEEREIVKVTDKSVFYLTSRGREDRELKCSNYYKWFDTREEAVEALKKRISDTIESHEANIVRLKIQLASIV